MDKLVELRHAFRIYAVCVPCGRMERVDLDFAVKRLGPAAGVEDLRPLLRCRVCLRRSGDLRVIYVGPEHRPATFRYRR